MLGPSWLIPRILHWAASFDSSLVVQPLLSTSLLRSKRTPIHKDRESDFSASFHFLEGLIDLLKEQKEGEKENS